MVRMANSAWKTCGESSVGLWVFQRVFLVGGGLGFANRLVPPKEYTSQTLCMVAKGYCAVQNM